MTERESVIIQMLMHRLNIKEDDASYYVNLSTVRVRDFLKCSEDEAREHLFAIADIAALMYQMDVASKAAEGSLGLKSESVSEGGVSRSVTVSEGSTIHSEYENTIQNILNSLISSGVMFI